MSSSPNQHGLGGLSPRVRGKRRKSPACGRARRSIPACAGETEDDDALHHSTEVYPRVCGGNPGCRRCSRKSGGLSPRVRGKRGGDGGRGRRAWSIPACAGETRSGRMRCSIRGVYPRVCGGNRPAYAGVAQFQGLSPRVRGKRGDGACSRCRPGSIPACAGETHELLPGTFHRLVYPRVCGGNTGAAGGWRSSRGLSPRVRGKHHLGQGQPWRRGSIPACAGET